MKHFFIVEIIRDENETITDRVVKSKKDNTDLPRGGEFVAISADNAIPLKHASVQVDVIDGEDVLSIVEDASKVAITTAEEEIGMRIARMEFGKRLIAIISIRNDAKSLDTSQITQFASDFSDTNTALLNGSIATAKALIEAITPDGTITTQADKDAMIGEINANETALGY